MVTLTHKSQAAIMRVSELRILTQSASIRNTFETGALRWVGGGSARGDGILGVWDWVRLHGTTTQIWFPTVRNQNGSQV